MLLKIFAAYDSKAAAFMQPFFFQTDGMARRAFGDLINDNNTMCGKHPGDFTLFQIGVYDDAGGTLEDVVSVDLGNGNVFLKNPENGT